MGKGSGAIAVSGSTGLVGTALCTKLVEEGQTVVPLVRDPRLPGIHWDPVGGTVEAAELEGTESVVHLAGENIASGRWTSARMARIRDSRVKGTRLLAEALASLETPPGVLVCASAMGYYGDRGEEELEEDSGPGTGYLPEVCEEWEAACEPARDAGIRVVNLRIGLVLAREGGALRKMLTPFRLGLAGQIGTGRQYMSWISMTDLVEIIRYALAEANLEGPLNVVAPCPVTNLEFTKTLGRILGRPTVLPLPGAAVSLLFGRMGKELLLGSSRVLPKRLLNRGFEFRYPDLESALRSALE